ncbi:hypothetical protein MCBG_02842 [Micromonospora sp. M42]|uniref:hypothetical protein n=1 Tax=Micromonospora sp. M42 TaxID=457406 RepID=UPI0003EEB4A7|nr:hypothetical protein [Micromonospora sp. M42]EWM65709.1 hypothetical protein MCBG_02842 [Micromonospora sp. M42]
MTDLSRPADGDDVPAGATSTEDSTPDSAGASAESGDRTPNDRETSDPGNDAVGAWSARRLLGAAVTALAGALVLVALVAPSEVKLLSLGALLRIPVEGLLAVALLLVLPARPRRVVATLLGALLGLILVLRVTDLGFSMVLDRRFDLIADLIADWTFLGAGAEKTVKSRTAGPPRWARSPWPWSRRSPYRCW